MSSRTFYALLELEEALKAEYGCDYAYTVSGRGNILAASNLKQTKAPERSERVIERGNDPEPREWGDL